MKSNLALLQSKQEMAETATPIEKIKINLNDVAVECEHQFSIIKNLLSKSKEEQQGELFRRCFVKAVANLGEAMTFLRVELKNKSIQYFQQ